MLGPISNCDDCFFSKSTSSTFCSFFLGMQAWTFIKRNKKYYMGVNSDLEIYY